MQLEFKEKKTAQTCHNNEGIIHEVSIEINGISNLIYKSCYNTTFLQTYYVEHEVKGCENRKKVVGKPNFVENGDQTDIYSYYGVEYLKGKEQVNAKTFKWSAFNDDIEYFSKG